MRHTLGVHARSAIFDLYGDHLRSRGDRAPVAAVVRMLAPLGIAAPAVRTAISRMVQQGWLEPVRLPTGRGYAPTERARRRLDDAAARVYRTRDASWDGTWDLLVVDAPAQRAARERLRSGLSFLGYAPLSESTWISPFRSAEVAALCTGEGVGVLRLRALDENPSGQARRAWDLEQLAEDYVAWLAFAERLLADPDWVLPSVSLAGSDERAFAVRSVLVHEWRKFLFTDPGLPAELLPADWVGHRAAQVFGREAAALLPAAGRFVDACLADPAQTGRTARPEWSAL